MAACYAPHLAASRSGFRCWPLEPPAACQSLGLSYWVGAVNRTADAIKLGFPAALFCSETARLAQLAAKAASATIPIVFGVPQDPVQLGLVASLARPRGNATGINFFFTEVIAKRLRLLHDLLPKAVRIAVLVNPANTPLTEITLREVNEAATKIGLQIQAFNATTIDEIDAAFATFSRMRPDALTSAAVRLRSPLSIIPVGILFRLFRNVHHRGF